MMILFLFFFFLHVHISFALRYLLPIFSTHFCRCTQKMILSPHKTKKVVTKGSRRIFFPSHKYHNVFSVILKCLINLFQIRNIWWLTLMMAAVTTTVKHKITFRLRYLNLMRDDKWWWGMLLSIISNHLISQS